MPKKRTKNRKTIPLNTKSLGDDIAGKRIAILGLAYKPDVDDLRESPAVEVANLLSMGDAKVAAYEPFSLAAKFELFETKSTLESTVTSADSVVLLVGHQEFLTIQPRRIANLTSSLVVIDAINGWSKTDWEKAGFSYNSL